MGGCSAFGCSNRSPEFKLYGYPTDPARRDLWALKTKRDGFVPRPHNHKLCQVIIQRFRELSYGYFCDNWCRTECGEKANYILEKTLQVLENVFFKLIQPFHIFLRFTLKQHVSTHRQLGSCAWRMMLYQLSSPSQLKQQKESHPRNERQPSNFIWFSQRWFHWITHTVKDHHLKVDWWH